MKNINLTRQHDNLTTEESNSIKLPEITIDSESKVGDHISDLCTKASMQLKAISSLKKTWVRGQ